MSEKQTDTPILDLSQEYQMIQGKEPTYFIQGNNVFNHRKEFWYSLKDNLLHTQEDDNNGYGKIEILAVPEPYDVEYIKCAYCDHEFTTEFGMERHMDKKHGYKLRNEYIKNKRKLCSIQKQ